MREGRVSMQMMKVLFLLMFLVTSSSLIMTAVASPGVVDSSSVIFQSCSDLQFQPSTPYQYALSTVLSSLSTSAGFTSYGNFTSTPIPPLSSPIYGLYQCHPTSSLSGCESCVRSAATYLSTTPPCMSSASATLQLRGCLLRYGNDSFMGRPDTSLLRRSCGPAASGGAIDPGGIAAMREGALAGVVAGAGTYRASGSGYVDALAQCVGDQGGGKQCSDCVTAAAEQLRDGCGMALSGEVYLGKCYAQYGVRGAYSYANGAGTGPQAVNGDSGNDHASEAGKDVAIIIGIVAAVLLIILFLNHIHKSSDDKGKS